MEAIEIIRVLRSAAQEKQRNQHQADAGAGK